MRISGRESRIKSTQSIVRKMIAKKKSVDEIEDLVGYRFIVRNLGDKKKLTSFLEETIVDAGFAPSPPTVRTVRTSSGYVADHVLCAVKSGKEGRETVAVEIQVRTILKTPGLEFRKLSIIRKPMLS